MKNNMTRLAMANVVLQGHIFTLQRQRLGLPHFFSFSFSRYQLLYFSCRDCPCVLVAVTIGGDANRGATTCNPLPRSPRRAVLTLSSLLLQDLLFTRRIFLLRRRRARDLVQSLGSSSVRVSAPFLWFLVPAPYLFRV